MEERDLLQKLNEDLEELSQIEDEGVLKDFDFDIFDRMKTNANPSDKPAKKSESDVAVDFNIAKKIAQAESEREKAKTEAATKEVHETIKQEKKRRALEAGRLAKRLHQERLKTAKRTEESLAQSAQALERSTELARLEAEQAEQELRAVTEAATRAAAARIEIEQFERERQEKERLESFTNAGKEFFKNIKESIDDAVKEDQKIFSEKPADPVYSRKERKAREKFEAENTAIKLAVRSYFKWVKHNNVVWWQSWKFIFAEHKDSIKAFAENVGEFTSRLKEQHRQKAEIRKAAALKERKRKQNEKLVKSRAEAIRKSRLAREEAAREEQRQILQTFKDEIKRLDLELKDTESKIEAERQAEIARIEAERKGELENATAEVDRIEAERRAAIAKIEAETRAEKQRIEAQLSKGLDKEEYEQKLAEAQFAVDDKAEKLKLESEFRAEVLRIDTNKRLEELKRSEGAAKADANAKYNAEIGAAQLKAAEARRVAEEEAQRQAAAAKNKEEQLARSNKKKSQFALRFEKAYFTWAAVWDQIEEERYLKRVDKQSAKNNKLTQKLNAKKIRKNQCDENIGSKEN